MIQTKALIFSSMIERHSKRHVFLLPPMLPKQMEIPTNQPFQLMDALWRLPLMLQILSAETQIMNGMFLFMIAKQARHRVFP
ncbi:hypothetical protein A9Q02_14050 [Candidatus Chloroploca asiatica]|uniref:Uncharacterized protein n=1 Tax=Candidatus Chloroploca asiatica TaxID=1506545 RepID=A0A2H3KYA7_9CHLR|nr:hypothetical protein A9Q02_14050 [Candidatus Chloroploca asiatica]